MSEKLRIDLTVLLPKIGEGDRCIELLTQRLSTTRGVEQAHIVRENGTAALCLHYDPNLLPLSQVERIARDAGARRVGITARYPHQAAAARALGVTDVFDPVDVESGRPVAILQKVQPRVQISPMIIMVAWPWPQHSPTFGQPASSQTVTSFFSRRMSRVFL